MQYVFVSVVLQHQAHPPIYFRKKIRKILHPSLRGASAMAQSRHLLALLLLLSLSASILAHGGGSDDADADSDASHPDLRSKSLILTKIWCLIVVFFATFLGGVSPYFLKWNEAFLALGTQFAGGVFLATAMIHFLSDANETFGDLTDVDYPFAFMLACAGYALTLLADVAISFVVARGQTMRDVENSQGSFFVLILSFPPL